MIFFHGVNSASALLLVIAVGVVGVLHTMVPDHWAPITLMARQRGWTRAQTTRAALGAGTGHVLSTLLLGAIVWGAGLAVAAKFGHWIDIISSGALIGFGFWIAYSGWREMQEGQAHARADYHDPGGQTHGHRTAMLLILGSSPMIEGLPAFFAAATIITYVALCVGSLATLERVKLGPLELYGEVLSGLFIAAVGLVFWIWPIT